MGRLLEEFLSDGIHPETTGGGLMELLKKIETGFAGLQITAEKKAAALRNLEEWVTVQIRGYVHAIERL